jgi:hypothetical protein
LPDMITLYAPEKPKPPHKCDTGMYVSFSRPTVAQGAVIECRSCGQLWYADREDKPGAGSPIFVIYWWKVRWYHFNLKKKAKEI